jgi:drug/metabolite transporter (DMT)-like permease
MWYRLMALAFLANGLGPFGLKVLAEKGLAGTYHYQYLVCWYASGLALALVTFLLRRSAPRWPEIWIAAVMGLGSFGGQLGTSLALESRIPGHIAFPITNGGHLFLVSAAGVFLFRERIGPYGIAGIITGMLSLVLLSVG